MYQASRRVSLRDQFQLRRPVLAGLGAGTTSGPSTTQMVQQVGSIASTATVAALQATVGSTGTILGLAGAAAIPIIGAAIAGITLGITAILNSGCGQTCIITSNWANQAAGLLEQNITAYFALPAPRTAEQKAQALSNFDNIWNYLQQQCSNPQLGTAGQRCITDRMAGACTWHQTGNPEFPGQPTTGQCWNWFNSYRDPIAADPAVVTDTTVSSLGGSNTTPGTTGGTGFTIGGSTFDWGTMALLAGGGLLLVAGLSGGR